LVGGGGSISSREDACVSAESIAFFVTETETACCNCAIDMLAEEIPFKSISINSFLLFYRRDVKKAIDLRNSIRSSRKISRYEFI
jgi:hypothetical protein